MSIKIIKPGQTEFHGFCRWCGCEFTYEISDLKLSATSDKVSCPTCGRDYYHSSMVQDPTIPEGIRRLPTWPPEPIPCTPDTTKTDPCAGCDWREKLLREGLYVGDTPCTWCDKNKFNTIAEFDSHLSTSTSSEPSEAKDATAYKCSDDVVNGKVMKTILSCCEANAKRMATNNTVYSPKNSPSIPPVPPTSGSNAVKGCNSCSGEHDCGGKKNCKGKH